MRICCDNGGGDGSGQPPKRLRWPTEFVSVLSDGATPRSPELESQLIPTAMTGRRHRDDTKRISEIHDASETQEKAECHHRRQ